MSDVLHAFFFSLIKYASVLHTTFLQSVLLQCFLHEEILAITLLESSGMFCICRSV